ncbi:hypothetical protein FVE85_4411 [Porphyridium purpureum]|uniref:Uncharacterized protein n=1 Tax=Porphyridium purpureum TaxID=35688 RepID=A0A5J4YIW6_PORPP|nr:hypothetical protein FVE85_4411 [Porphyridium purpureum]|eukprot:POR4426..scf270_19
MFPSFGDDSVLNRCLLMIGPTMMFEQDKAPVHNDRLLDSFKNGRNTELLDLPAYSRYFNCIAHLREILSRTLYEGPRQRQTMLELKITITLA